MLPANLTSALKALGCVRLLAKRLSPNDNSKNQIYLGGDYSAIQLLPFGKLVEDSSEAAKSKRARLKAPVEFRWLLPDGRTEQAPNANLILYPKYPEVRLSGILSGIRITYPSEVIATRLEGRWLFFGITPQGSIIGYACVANDPSAAWADEMSSRLETHGVFLEFPIFDFPGDIRDQLRAIAERGWIRSKRLDRDGVVQGCESENCGGYTLEAELGIRPNGRAEPDYHGWEVKQFNVRNLARPTGEQITLFTPEPNGGLYLEKGVDAFLRKYGYPDLSGIPDRINFGGAHKFGQQHPRTLLTFTLVGWSPETKKIDAIDGGIRLLDPSGDIAASWSFAGLINHWKTKHAKAVFVPSIRRADPREYRFGEKVFAAQGTDFSLVLESVTKGFVLYDPGIKMETASGTPKIKRRSQFRIRFANLGSLYHKTEWWDLKDRIRPE